MGVMRRITLSVGVAALTLAAASCATQMAIPDGDAPGAQPGDGRTEAPFTYSDSETELAEDAVDALREKGQSVDDAVMTVTTYADYMAVLESDVTLTEPLLPLEARVVIVAVDGSVATAGIKWPDFAGPIPETRGALVALDTDGRVLSSKILFADYDEKSANADRRGPVERLAELETPVVQLDI